MGYSDDAALEARRAACRGTDFADQIEPRDFAESLLAGRRRHCLLADIGNQADDHGLARHHAHEFSDGRLLAAGAAQQ